MDAIKKQTIGRLNDGPRRMFHLLGRDVDCLVDTGAPVNVIDEETFSSLCPKPELAKCNTSYYPYGEGVTTPLAIIGQFTGRVWYRDKECQAGFVVVKGKEECLMSYRTAKTLGIISMDDNHGVGSINKPETPQRVRENKVENITKSFPPPKKNGRYSKDELKVMFPSLFSGTLGCLKDVRVHLHLDPEVKPVRQKLRPLPFHLREAVSKEIKKQIELGILERVTDDMGPTPWVSNIVPVLKDKEVKLGRDGKPSPVKTQTAGTPEVRITVDNRAQNKAIRRTHYPTKTVEELLYEANGSKLFSKLDIIKAFHQFMLEESQRQLTVITTHEGLLRYTRLHMGISCASEEFSEHIRRVLEGIIGQVNMTDDVLIHGANEQEHQQALLSTLKKLEDAGLTLNLEKCEFYKEEVKFYGLRFTKDGVSPTEERVKALKECATPTDVKSLRSFLCTVLWSARFMKDICTIAEPLWKLTKNGMAWQWTTTEQNAFQALKDGISTKCMGYFRKDWETELVSDASPVGLGGVLCQFNPEDPTQRHIVCFLSRLLTDVERRFSQAEKEALGVVWLCEKAAIYLIGHRFRIVVDNRAVMLIYGNARSKPPARIERWALRLTPFDFEIVHRPGISNMADYYSRSPGNPGVSAYLEEVKTEQHICMVVQAALPPAMTIQDIAEATNGDPELTELRKRIIHGGKLPKELAAYQHMVHELSVTTEGIVLRDTRIVIPKSLRTRTVELAHGGHQGIVKTKRLIRSRVWFQGIDDLVEQHVRHCRECQSNTDRQSFEPLKPSKMPDKPWQSVSADFFGPTPGGWYWFVNICDHSNKAFVSKIWAPSEDSVEPVLDHLFSTFGAPETYKTDNGSPFQSHRFMDFAKKWGFKHRRVTPEWPRANGKAESFMKKLGKVLKTAKIGGTNEQEALMEFLRRYNETPHSTTGVAPNHLFLGFSRSSGIPSMLPETPEQREKWRKLALENDARAKKRMETEYNRRMRAKEPTISVGSQVLVKLKKQRKDTSAWDREPYTVTAVNGSMVTASRRDHTVTRNSSCFKLYRHVGFDLPDEEAAKSAPTPVQPNPEGREELAQASQRASQETVPSQETADQAAQDLPVVHSNKSAQPKHSRTQRGRPTLEESAKIQQARAEAQAAKRALNPPTRQSIRTQVKR
jgi:transposase InsO family protein